VLLLGRIEGKWHNPTVRTYVKLLPAAMAATVTLGVAPLLFLQLVYHRQAYSAAIVSAWLWLGIIVAAIIAYYLFYGASFSAENKSRRLPLYLAAALVMLLFVSFVYSTVFSLAERPDLYRMLYAGNQSGAVVNTDVGSWAFRWLHMVLGAVTIGGFFIGLVGRNDEPAFKLGKTFFLLGMIATMIAGLGYLFTLGDNILPFMRSPAIWVLMGSIILSLGSLHFFFKKKWWGAGTMVFVSLLGMVTIRHMLRLIVLGDQFEPGTIPVRPQWSVFAVFLVSFVLAVGLVAYLLRLFLTQRRQAA
jgi:MFS family permease